MARKTDIESAADFRKSVKISLLEQNKTEAWLMERVKEKTGMYLDHSYLNKIYRGERNARKIVGAIKEILALA